MTDRELLELAAKACGWSLFYYGSHCTVQVAPGMLLDWNPLEEDGDAFRLMVKMNLAVSVEPGEAWAHHESVFVGSPVQHDGRDPYAATRRAIVRAAAEIGKGMK